jgi:hypothetical protein
MLVTTLAAMLGGLLAYPVCIVLLSPFGWHGGLSWEIVLSGVLAGIGYNIPMQCRWVAPATVNSS